MRAVAPKEKERKKKEYWTVDKIQKHNNFRKNILEDQQRDENNSFSDGSFSVEVTSS
jgi:hypothetical protein